MPSLQDLLGYGAQGYNLYQTKENLDDATHDIKQGFTTANQNIKTAYQPYTEFGLENLQGYKDLGEFSYTGQDMYADPSYNWRLQQGLQGVERSAAAKGSLYAGKTLADLNNYAQGAASQEYQAAFDRANRTYDTNRDYYGFGVTTGAKAAGEMGTNLADLAIGQGGSLAALHGAEAEMINRQLNALGAQLANSPNAGAQTPSGGSIVGSIKGALGELLDVDTLGNLFDSVTGEIVGNLGEVSNWMGNFGDVGGLIDAAGNVDWGGLFTPTGVNNGIDAIKSLFGGEVPTIAGTDTVDYGKMFEVTNANGMNALNLDLANTWVQDDSWWDKFSSGVTNIGSDIWSGIKSFFL